MIALAYLFDAQCYISFQYQYSNAPIIFLTTAQSKYVFVSEASSLQRTLEGKREKAVARLCRFADPNASILLSLSMSVACIS